MNKSYKTIWNEALGAWVAVGVGGGAGVVRARCGGGVPAPLARRAVGW